MKEKCKSHRFCICDVENDILVSHEHTICFGLAHTFISRALFLLDLKNPLRRIWWVGKYAADDVLPHFIAQFSPRLIRAFWDVIGSPACTILHCLRCLNFGKHCSNYAFLCISCELPPECPPSAPSSLYARQLPTQEKWGIGRGGVFHSPHSSSYQFYVFVKKNEHMEKMQQLILFWKTTFSRIPNGHIPIQNQQCRQVSPWVEINMVYGPSLVSFLSFSFLNQGGS